MKVIAIDPGNEHSAVVRLVDGKPYEHAYETNRRLLAMLQEWRRPDVLLAVEMIASYGMPVGREVFDTCVWIGRFLQAWGGRSTMVFRKDVKLFLCQSMRANDAIIRQALIDIFGPGREKAIGTKTAPGPLYGIHGDEWAALAVGVTVHHTYSQARAA